jgi:hypothetical protein
VSGFNIPHSFYTNFVYDLPGHNVSGAAGRLLGGWNVSGILRLTSGPPGQIAAATPRSGRNALQFTGGSTIDLIPGGNNNPMYDEAPTHSAGGIIYFDASQFSWPASFLTDSSLRNVPGMGVNGAPGNLVAQGNLGRNTLVMPGVANVDFTVTKDTAIGGLGENGGIEFRAEFYNLFNRVNYGNPSLSVFDSQGRASPTAGRITSTRIPARQIQLALKLLF